MTADQINKHNTEVQKNREIVRQLWERLGRKPTIAEMEAALNAK